jgi:hypothetical protein
MKRMSLDFSQKIDLTPLAVVVRALQSVAQGCNTDKKRENLAECARTMKSAFGTTSTNG